MKQYYDVYIALYVVGGVIADISDMSTWDKIKLADPKAKLTAEPVLKETGDGTNIVEAEKVMFECGELKVSTDLYAYLRATYHNAMVKVALIAPGSNGITVESLMLRAKVNLLITSGDTNIIKISAEREIPVPEPYLSEKEPLKMSETSQDIIVWGRVFNPDGITPIPYAAVTAETVGDSSSDTSDANGYYVINVKGATDYVSMDAVKSGFTFASEDVAVLSDEANTVEHNIIATGSGT